MHLPPGNWFPPPGSNRNGGGGNDGHETGAAREAVLAVFSGQMSPRLGLLKSYQYLYNATTSEQWLQRLPNHGAKHAISVGAFHGVTCN